MVGLLVSTHYTWVHLVGPLIGINQYILDALSQSLMLAGIALIVELVAICLLGLEQKFSVDFVARYGWKFLELEAAQPRFRTLFTKRGDFIGMVLCVQIHS